MVYSKRTKPISLVIMESLERRTTLSRKHTNYLRGMQKGFQGELAFDRMAEELGQGCVILKDLFLQPNMSNAFQLDALIVIGETIYLYEIKNYSGEYTYGPEMLLKKPDFELSNPLIQLQNTKNRLKIFLKELGYVLEIKAYVAYVNPEFTLFHAPKLDTVLLPTQLNSHFSELTIEAAALLTPPKKFVQDLMKHNVAQPRFIEDIPEYNFSDLKKGVTCEECGSFELVNYRQNYQCCNCGFKNPLHSALLNTITEYQRLFPESKLTTGMMYNWCNKTASKKRIKRALNEIRGKQ
ncbi:nuclease-related domain-containing protein [Carnobacterium sp.]|uniref:nuclease-related domain-containing protein n=1 Tax=Carnobacterium sp. TaxID=48221 RepID=UPI003C776907